LNDIFENETALPLFKGDLGGSKLKNLDRKTCVYTVAKKVGRIIV